MRDYERVKWHSNPYLTFQVQDLASERKTDAVEVIAVRDGTLLGMIRWYGPWRQYVFAPESACVFNPACLSTITANVSALTAAHRTKPYLAAASRTATGEDTG